MSRHDSFGARLELAIENKTVRIVPIGAGGIQIGRDPNVDLRFDDARISRRHARIEPHSDGHYYLVDTSTHQATCVNDRRILEARPVRLEDGDRLTFGDNHLVFRCESRVLPADSDDGASVLETIADLSSLHLVKRARRPAETLRTVLNITRSLGGGGELDEVLDRFVGNLMELFPHTECGVIVTAEPDGTLPVRAMRKRGGPPPKLTLSRTILRQVLEQGEAVLIRDVATDDRFKAHGSVSALFRSAVCVPLLGSAGKAIGMIQLGAREESGGRFTSEDLELLATLALPLAAAVENDRLLRERAHWAAAREIQRALLPRERPDIAGYSFWECYRPALEVGGDSYDYIRPADNPRDVPTRWVIAVGDVSGKGMPAALLAAAVCPEVRHAVQAATSPGDVLTRVNRHVFNSGFDARFVTMILAELDTQNHRITLANAGHELPLIRRANGRVEKLSMRGAGMPLGIDSDCVYESTVFELLPGEVVVFHTDGLIDARDRQGSRFGIELAMQALSAAPALASLAGQALLEAVMRHSEGVAPFDDLTLVCIGRETT